MQALFAFFLSCIFQLLLQSISRSPSHVRMLMFLPALNLKLSVAPSAPIIANYLLQPQAMCRLASSNQTLLFSRQGCVARQKRHFNSLNIPSCHWIWVRVRAPCQTHGEIFQVLTSFCQIRMLFCYGAHNNCLCKCLELRYIRSVYYTAFL